MHSGHTQKLILPLVLLLCCGSFAQSPIGGYLVPIKNTYGSTIYRGQIVTGDSTNSTLVQPYWAKDASVTTGATAYACSLDGTNALYIDLGMNALWAGPDSFSIEYWIKPASISGTQWVYAEDNRVEVGLASDRLQFTTYNTVDAFITTVSNQNETVGVWKHVVNSFRSNYEMVIYLNSVPVCSTLASYKPLYYVTWKTYIGYGQYDMNNLHGVVDEFRLYNKPLSQDTINAHYNGGLGQYGSQNANQIGAYHLDDGTGITADDYGPNGLDGTLIGTSQYWVAGKVAAPSSSVGGKVLYAIGTVYNDSIPNGTYGFMTTAGAGYVAVKKNKTESVRPGKRNLITSDSVGLADCEVPTGAAEDFRNIGHPLTILFAVNARGDSICIADIYKN